MPSKRKEKRLGEENLQRIIDLCRSVEERGVDPFLPDVDQMLTIIRQYFPEWKEPEELCLDAETLHKVASTIGAQSEWVKHRSTSLYTDPLLIKEKLRKLPKEELAALFARCWHPIVELEQVSPQSLTKAIDYWQSRIPFSQRVSERGVSGAEAGSVSREELLGEHILPEQEFSSQLNSMWHELKNRTEGKGRIEYWDFIGAESYEETIRRAYLTSFLVTYGYATLEIDRLEEIVNIIPLSSISTVKPNKKQALSYPIPVSWERWREWKEGLES